MLFRKKIIIFLCVSVCFFLQTALAQFKIQKNIKIDQFGYRPGDKKIAVVVDPQIGFNSKDHFKPGSVYEVRASDNNKIVFTGKLSEWKRGSIDFSSGDKGWWFDFTELKQEGEYYIFDPDKNVRSFAFRIAGDVYKDILKAAIRTFYYQRLNDAKRPPFAESPWIDSAAFIGPGQDSEAHYLKDSTNELLVKNLSGGWMDAGDYNKYVTFAENAVHQLLTSFEQNPKIFTDDYNIPESGNGIPDLLDEVRYEIDWIIKMQDVDGGVYIKLGNIDYNVSTPPSADKRPRFYGPKCSSSSIAAAGMFAHASIIFSNYSELTVYAADLKNRAVKAWDWYKNNPRSADCDNGEIKSGDADRSLDIQDQMEVVSAVYLFALTGEAKYDSVIRNNFYKAAPFYDSHLAMYFSCQGDALLYYANLNNADPVTGHAILSQRAKQGFGKDLFRFRDSDDLYMAYLPVSLYNWGSNNARAALGSATYDFVFYRLNIERKERYMNRALGILHYFHGVNPLEIVYLSNMYRYGAELCADNIWHDWFKLGSKWGIPPPGYVPGGPNSNYEGSISELSRQPFQKCYRNWNRGYPENSWEMTEPAIYYEAAYIKLVSKFVDPE